MFGGMEWVITPLVILLVVLFGGKKIPELAKGMGSFMAQFKIGKEQAEKELKKVIEETDLKSSDKKTK